MIKTETKTQKAFDDLSSLLKQAGTNPAVCDNLDIVDEENSQTITKLSISRDNDQSIQIAIEKRTPLGRRLEVHIDVSKEEASGTLYTRLSGLDLKRENLLSESVLPNIIKKFINHWSDLNGVQVPAEVEQSVILSKLKFNHLNLYDRLTAFKEERIPLIANPKEAWEVLHELTKLKVISKPAVHWKRPNAKISERDGLMKIVRSIGYGRDAHYDLGVSASQDGKLARIRTLESPKRRINGEPVLEREQPETQEKLLGDLNEEISNWLSENEWLSEYK